MSPHRRQATPDGQRIASKVSRHFASSLYLSINVNRLIFRPMAQTPKKKRRRTVPSNIRDKTDREIMETVFGKRLVKAAEAEAQAAKPVIPSMYER